MILCITPNAYSQSFSDKFNRAWNEYKFPSKKTDDKKAEITYCDKTPTKGKKIQINTKKVETLFEEIDRPYGTEGEDYVGKIDVKITRHKNVQISEKYDLVTFFAISKSAETKFDNPVSSYFLLTRYLAKKGKVLKLTASIAGNADKFLALSKILEAELMKMYSSGKVEKDGNSYQGLARPKCQLNFTESYPGVKDWDFQGIVKQSPNFKEKILGNKKYFIRQSDASVYTKSKDSILYSYFPKVSFRFEYKERKYFCFREGGKRDATLESYLHIIVQDDLKKLVADGDNEEFGKVYRKIDDPEIENFYKEVVDTYIWFKNDDMIPDRSEFNKMLPIVYIVDPLSRVYQCRARSLESNYSEFVEPLIYIYTDKPQSVTVSLEPEVRIKSSDPLHKNNSWTVLTNTKGTLWHEETKKNYSSLFWEGRKEHFPLPPKTGQLIKAEDLSAFFDKYLKGFGLNQKEIQDFKKFWVPELEKHKQVLIDFMLNSEVDEFVTIKSTPSMPQIRVYVNYWPVESKDFKYEKKEFKSIVRPTGNVLIEWGGVSWALESF